MSVTFKAVDWNKSKKRYDWTLLCLVVSVLVGFMGSALFSHPEITVESLLIRGTAITAALLLTLVLSVGPLTRIDPRFLPLLYNRRHLGVVICLIACLHAGLSIFQFHALGNFPARLSFLSSYFHEFHFLNPSGSLSEIPFEPFGLISLSILILMALTSHDFWLKILGALNWKRIHVLVYFAYFSLIVHISLGLLQSEESPVILSLVLLSPLWLVALHVLSRGMRDSSETDSRTDGFIFACALSELSELENGRGKVVTLEGKRIALFLHQDQVRALSNICKHQGGPLGEGRIVNGCVTCPWHGWQYIPETGCSPPPFKEVVPTYLVRVEEEKVFVHL